MTQRSFYLLSIISGITLFLLSPLFINNPVRAAIVINELLPKTEPAANEWVELYNTGSESVSLDRWKLQTATGFVQTFILNASAIISPHGFLTVTGSQTGISFAVGGDSVLLFDDKNTEMDHQNFPGILGYNTSMGRSIDGGGTWVICASTSFNTNNNCPIPSPTPILAPTNTPTPTPSPIPLLPTRIPTPTPAGQSPLGGATPTPFPQTFGSFLPSPATTQVLGVSATTTPTPTPDKTKFILNIDKILAFQILAVALSWTIIAAVAYVRKQKRVR